MVSSAAAAIDQLGLAALRGECCGALRADLTGSHGTLDWNRTERGFAGGALERDDNSLGIRLIAAVRCCSLDMRSCFQLSKVRRSHQFKQGGGLAFRPVDCRKQAAFRFDMV